MMHMPVNEAIEAIATAMKNDDHATPEAAGVPALALLGHFLHEQKRTADALERIAAALEAPEPK